MIFITDELGKFEKNIIELAENVGFKECKTIEAIDLFCGISERNDVLKEKDRYYAFIDIPQYWSVRADGLNGAIYDNKTKKANIYFKNPIEKRMVSRVEWIDRNNTVYRIGYYNKYGYMYCSENVSGGNVTVREFYDRNGDIKVLEQTGPKTYTTFGTRISPKSYRGFADYLEAYLKYNKIYDENIWLTQKMMATLYDVDVRTINEHIKKIYSDSELEEDSTIRNFRIVQTEGSRQVTRDTKHYNLQMIIAVGFKVNNERAVQFRKWANGIVKDYTIKGWVMDDERLKNGGSVLTVEYFDRLLEQIREIRLSERRFYQKITDIYATALDYDRTAKTTKQFFAKVQNKMHYAVHGHTAAELIYERADADKPHMGLTTWAAAPEGKIVKSDVSVAKNYLSEKEMRSLERIVSAYLDLAEDRAERHIPMTMEDWAKRLDLFLMADDRDVLQDAGKITAEIAKAKAETEFEKYRVIQDRLFMSDFDKYMLELEENAKK